MPNNSIIPTHLFNYADKYRGDYFPGLFQLKNSVSLEFSLNVILFPLYSFISTYTWACYGRYIFI